MKLLHFFWLTLVAVQIIQKCVSLPVAKNNIAVNKAGFENDSADKRQVPAEPEFLLRIQKCKNRYKNQVQCLHFTGKDENDLKQIIDNPDFFLGFVGNGSFENFINFEVQNRIKEEDLHSIDLLLHKQRLTQAKLNQISTERCNYSESGLKLQLILQENNFVVQNLSLTPSMLLENEWIVFQHLEKWYFDWASHSTITFLKLRVKLLLQDECSPMITFFNFSIESTVKGYEPLLVVYSKASDTDNEFETKFMQQFELPTERDKRRIVSSATSTNSTTSPEATATSSGSYQDDPTHPCSLFLYEVPTKFIPEVKVSGPVAVNFCSGHCHHPLDKNNTTNHSKLLSYLHSSSVVTNKPSKPCCSVSKYHPLAALHRINSTSSMFELRQIPDVTAVECLCQ